MALGHDGTLLGRHGRHWRHWGRHVGTIFGALHWSCDAWWLMRNMLSPGSTVGYFSGDGAPRARFLARILSPKILSFIIRNAPLTSRDPSIQTLTVKYYYWRPEYGAPPDPFFSLPCHRHIYYSDNNICTTVSFDSSPNPAIHTAITLYANIYTDSDTPWYPVSISRAMGLSITSCAEKKDVT